MKESHLCLGAGPVETPGMEPGHLVVPLLLNERPILGDILESLENRLQGTSSRWPTLRE